jgi:carbon-monoxide dehydrogenase small subunit
VQARGASVTTIEGVGSPTAMHPIQQAFLQAMSFQCGFCTPGVVITVLAYLTERSEPNAGAPSDGEIRVALGGQLCRCTGYRSIVDGVRGAWELMAINEP